MWYNIVGLSCKMIMNGALGLDVESGVVQKGFIQTFKYL